MIEVFLSWSKQTSHKVAKAFKDWLPNIFPSNCWMSSQDIGKGKPWFGSISEQLAKSEVCIICVTQENLDSHWLMYEAGAIAHAKHGKLVCPLLFKVTPSEISGSPLGQFQATITEKDDVLRLLLSMNNEISTSIPEGTLRAAFQNEWPKLQKALRRIELKAPEEILPKVSPVPQTLSEEANDVLRESLKDDTGRISICEESDGTFFGPIFIGTDIPNYGKVSAKYRSAIEELHRKKLINSNDPSEGSYLITPEGYELAELLIANAPKPQLTNENDITAELQEYIKKHFRAMSTSKVAFEDVDKELNLSQGSTKRLIRHAAEKQGFEVETWGEVQAIFKHHMVHKAKRDQT